MEDHLMKETSYHGYLPREEMVSMLQRHGDFLLRSVEREPTSKESVGSQKNAGHDRKRSLVISVLMDPDGELQKHPIDKDTKEAMIKSIIVNPAAGNRVCVEGNHRFTTITELLCYYKEGIRIGTAAVPLKKAVKLAKWEYTHKDVIVGIAIGEGVFSQVFKGHLTKKDGKTVQVAVKAKKKNTSNADVGSKEKIHDGMANEYVKEARLMTNLHHPNVVKFYGIALSEKPFYTLTELITGGTLHEYLSKNSGEIDRHEKLQMVVGAAWGVAYVHGEGIIHRDLAARNFLYDSNKNVKLTGFGMARNSSMVNFTKSTRVPVKWMAPESFELFHFTQKTDVYTYGILVFEIFSGKSPYEGQPNTVAKKNIVEGMVNIFPNGTPRGLQKMVNDKLWAKEPRERFNMKYVVRWMEDYTGFSLVGDEDDAARKNQTLQTQDEPNERATGLIKM